MTANETTKKAKVSAKNALTPPKSMQELIDDGNDEDDKSLPWLFNQFDCDFGLAMDILKGEERYEFINYIITAVEKAKKEIAKTD